MIVFLVFFKSQNLHKLAVTLVGAKPQEVLSLSKNERSAVGGRRSGGTDHFGRPALEGQLPEVGGRRWRSVLLANFFY